jgi:hypothetical protein
LRISDDGPSPDSHVGRKGAFQVTVAECDSPRPRTAPVCPTRSLALTGALVLAAAAGDDGPYTGRDEVEGGAGGAGVGGGVGVGSQFQGQALGQAVEIEGGEGRIGVVRDLAALLPVVDDRGLAVFRPPRGRRCPPAKPDAGRRRYGPCRSGTGPGRS